VMRLLENNENHFVYLTNGSNGVADDYILDVLHCASADQQIVSLSIFKHDYFYFIEQFAVAFHAQDTDMMQQVRYQIFFKIFVQVFGCQTEADLDRKVFEVLEFFAGKLNAIEAQQVSILIDYLKGRLRQSESDSKWMIAQGHCRNVYHFGAQFYLYGESLATLQDQIIEQDVQRFVEHLRKVQPQIVTVALDPCGVGPSTHFTTLQVIAKALQRYGDETIQFIGYRNVWSCFSVTQASLMVPVTADDMEQMEKVFLNCFATQKDPLHPSPLHEGTFSDVSRQFQEHQMQDVQLLLGDQFEDIRVTRGDSLTKPSVKTGMIFLQKLTLHDLQKIAMEVARK